MQILICSLVIWLFGVGAAFGANYSLQVTNIKPAGTGSPAIPSTNRIFRAYPGIEYNIRPAVVGGVYPYTFSLSGQPSGMTINPSTGEIRWPNPQSNSGTIILHVTDSESTTITATWAITVATSGFYFVDSSVGSNGTGTIASPFKTLLNAIAGTSDTDILYFRAGTHTVVSNDSDDGGSGCLYWAHGASTWLAYPGESVTIDGNLNSIKLAYPGYGAYIDGISLTHFRHHGLLIPSYNHYVLIRRSNFSNLSSDSGTGNNYNQGFIANPAAEESNGYYWTIQDNDLSGFHGGQAIGSLYTLSYLLVEDNYIHDGGDQSTGVPYTEAIGLKRQMYYNFVRHNRIIYSSVPDAVMEIYNSQAGTDMEITYNLIVSTNSALTAFRNWFTPNLYVEHNTIVGRIVNMAVTDSSCANAIYHYSPYVPGAFRYNAYDPLGPYTFANNVIINPNTDGSGFTTSDHFSFESCTASACKSCVADTTNLKATATSGVVDTSYLLVNRDYVGTYGWETGGTTPVDGVCGSNDGGTFASLTSGNANNCSVGSVSGFSGSGPWSWSCLGTDGGADDNCSASLASQATGVKACKGCVALKGVSP